MKDLRKFIKTTIREFLNENYQNINYISGKEFKKKYIDGEFLWKGYFRHESEEDAELYSVSDIKQYGDGAYFCASLNCQSHYSDNVGFVDSDEFILSDNAKICVNSYYDYFLENEEHIRKNCDGFYDPEYDTFGLVLWNKKYHNK